MNQITNILTIRVFRYSQSQLRDIIANLNSSDAIAWAWPKYAVSCITNSIEFFEDYIEEHIERTDRDLMSFDVISADPTLEHEIREMDLIGNYGVLGKHLMGEVDWYTFLSHTPYAEGNIYKDSFGPLGQGIVRLVIVALLKVMLSSTLKDILIIISILLRINE